MRTVGIRLQLAFSVAVALPCAGVRGQPAAPPTQPASAPSLSPELWARMQRINARGLQIASLSADFTQEKHTALLRKPLRSSGRVRVEGSTMRWDTQQPQASVLLITQKQVEVYYPAQKTLEVYTLDQRLGELAASPLPRLDVLKKRFSFVQIPVKDMDARADPDKCLALRLLPMDAALREHLQEVRVLLDESAGYMIAAQMTDADGDLTIVHFSHVKTGAAVGDLRLNPPPGTRVTHPLEGLEGAAPDDRR
jgi:outer membrane lipoprotein-sorting protein